MQIDTLDDVLPLLVDLPRDPDAAAEVLEAVATWLYLQPEAPAKSPVKAAITKRLTALAKEEGRDTELLKGLAKLLRGSAKPTFVEPERETKEKGPPRVTHYRKRAEVLRDRPDAAAVGALLTELRARTFRASNSLTALVEALRTTGDDEAREVADVLWRRRHYRGMEPVDLSDPIEDRIEAWAFQAEYAFGDLTDLDRRRAGQLLAIAGDLCALETADDWARASQGLVDANFHTLAERFEERAQALRASVG